jgi:hypothetical protein
MVEDTSNDFRLNYAAFSKMEVIRISGSISEFRNFQKAIF